MADRDRKSTSEYWSTVLDKEIHRDRIRCRHNSLEMAGQGKTPWHKPGDSLSRVSKHEIQLPRTAHRTSRPLHLRVVCHLKLGKVRQPFFERHLHLHAR
jgi:hypothetical protein